MRDAGSLKKALYRLPEPAARVFIAWMAQKARTLGGGFRLLNFEYYRDMFDAEDRRKQVRDAQKRLYDKKKISLINPHQISSKISPQKQKQTTPDKVTDAVVG
jgi:hypothetical protein